MITRFEFKAGENREVECHASTDNERTLVGVCYDGVPECAIENAVVSLEPPIALLHCGCHGELDSVLGITRDEADVELSWIRNTFEREIFGEDIYTYVSQSAGIPVEEWLELFIQSKYFERCSDIEGGSPEENLTVLESLARALTPCS